MSHPILRAAATGPLATSRPRLNASITRKRSLNFYGSIGGIHATSMPLQYHCGLEIEGWATSSHDFSDTTVLSAKDNIQSFRLQTDHAKAFTSPKILYTNTNKVPTSSMRSLDIAAQRALHTMTEAASQRVRPHDQAVKRVTTTCETSCEFSRAQHALREARWEQVWNESQRVKEERVVTEVMEEAERTRVGWAMFCSLW